MVLDNRSRLECPYDPDPSYIFIYGYRAQGVEWEKAFISKILLKFNKSAELATFSTDDAFLLARHIIKRKFKLPDMVARRGYKIYGEYCRGADLLLILSIVTTEPDSWNQRPTVEDITRLATIVEEDAEWFCAPVISR